MRALSMRFGLCAMLGCASGAITGDEYAHATTGMASSSSNEHDVNTLYRSFEQDRILALPGLDGKNRSLPSLHYSGYLDATDGCDTQVNGDFCMIHYWLCTAEVTTSTDNAPSDENRRGFGDSMGSMKDKTIPIVVWFNGGPGASSMVGLFQELGPLLLNQHSDLIDNPYSWTKVAHLLVLEGPVGVGFSYSQAEQEDDTDNDDGSRDYSACQNTNETTATAARAALVSFFVKFPHLASNDVYLTGESYAGVYVPTLAYEILQYNNRNKADNQSASINLQGILVGDPCTDVTAQSQFMNPLWYGFEYGLVDEAIYDALAIDALCKQWMAERHEEQMAVDNLSITKTRRAQLLLRRSGAVTTDDVTKEQASFSGQPQPPPKCILAYRKFLLSSSRGIDGKWDRRFIDRFSLFAPVTNVLNEALESYLNRPDVQEAIYVTPIKNRPWAIHAADFEYTKQYHACNHMSDDVPETRSMIDFYRKIVPHLRVTWILNGDTDPAVTYEGTRVAVVRIGFPEVDGGGYRPWFYNQSAIPVSTNFLLQNPSCLGPTCRCRQPACSLVEKLSTISIISPFSLCTARDT